MSASSPYIHVKLDVAKGDVHMKSVDIVRTSPDLAIVNVEVAGKAKGLRFDVGKQAFFDSLGSRKLDKAVADLKEPLTVGIASAKRKSGSKRKP